MARDRVAAVVGGGECSVARRNPRPMRAGHARHLHGHGRRESGVEAAGQKPAGQQGADPELR